MSDFDAIDLDDVQRRLDDGGIEHFWNVLTDDYFTGETIPGSRRVPLGRVVREARRLELDEGAEIVVYCAGPECPQSAAAAEKLADQGFTNVHDFDGGLEAWKASGRPVERTAEGVAAD